MASKLKLPPNITIEGAQFVYKTNFSGAKTQFKDEGYRFFNLLIPDEIVDRLRADGWNIKMTKPKNPEEEAVRHFLEVKVGFEYRPPSVVLIADNQQTILDENTVGTLDSAQLENVDLVVRGRVWESPSGTGISAYLQTLYATAYFDDIQKKYARLAAQARTEGQPAPWDV